MRLSKLKNLNLSKPDLTRGKDLLEKSISTFKLTKSPKQILNSSSFRLLETVENLQENKDFKLIKSSILNNLKVINSEKFPTVFSLPRGSIGDILFDVTDSTFYGYNGSEWLSFGLAPSFNLNDMLAVGNDALGEDMTNVGNVTMTGTLSATTVSGGNLDMNGSNITTTGTIYGNAFSGTLLGVAATAGKLSPGRVINGVLYTGEYDITIGCEAAGLTGATLAGNVINSSLESFGTLVGLTMGGPLDLSGNNLVSVNFLSASTITTGSIASTTFFANTLSANVVNVNWLTGSSFVVSTSLSSSTVFAGGTTGGNITSNTATINQLTGGNLVSFRATCQTFQVNSQITLGSVVTNNVTATFMSVGTGTFTGTLTANSITANYLRSTFASAVNANVTSNVQAGTVIGVNLYANHVFSSTLTITTTLTANNIIGGSVTATFIGGDWRGTVLLSGGGTGTTVYTTNSVLYTTSGDIRGTNVLPNAILATNPTPFMSATLPIQVQNGITQLGTLTKTLDLAGNNLVGAATITLPLIQYPSSYERITSNGPATINPDIINTIVQSGTLGQYNWRAYVTNSNGRPNGVATNESGDVFFGGSYLLADVSVYSSNDVFFRSMPFVGRTDAPCGYLVKYNSLGIAQWSTYNTTDGRSNQRVGINHVSVNNKGDCVVTGYTQEAGLYLHNGDMSVAFRTNTIVSNNDVLSIFYDNFGRPKWSARTSGFGQGQRVKITDTAVYITAQFTSGALSVYNSDNSLSIIFPSSSLGNQNIALIKYNMNGFVQWGRLIMDDFNNSFSEFAYDLSVNKYDDIVVTGQFSSTVFFYQNQTRNTIIYSLGSVGGADAFIVKYNSNGVFNWATKLGTINTDSGQGIHINDNGDIVATGHYISTLNIYNSGGITIGLTLPSSGTQDVYIVRYSNAGNPIWATRIDGAAAETATDIVLTNSGKIVATGYYQSNPLSVYSSSGALVFTMPYSGSNDIYVIRYTLDGVPVWGNRIAGSGNDVSTTVDMNSKGEVLLSGYWGTTSPSIFTGFGRNLSATIPGDTFVAKFTDETAYLTLPNAALDGQRKIITSTGPVTYIYPLATINNITGTITLFANETLSLVWDAVNSNWSNVSSALQISTSTGDKPALTFLPDTDTGVSSTTLSELKLSTNGLSRANINSSGLITTPKTCVFYYYLPTTTANFTGGGATYYTVTGLTLGIDYNSNFNGTTGVFTVPINGIYNISGSIVLGNITSSAFNDGTVGLYNGTAFLASSQKCNVYNLTAGGSVVCLNFSFAVRVYSTNTITVRVAVSAGTKTISLIGTNTFNTDATWISGYLVG